MLRLLSLAALLSACEVGTIEGGPIGGGPGSGSNHGAPDGGTSGNRDAAVTGGDASSGFACRNQVPTAQLGDGHHNAGQDCMNGCHNHGFTLAGTLFAAANSTTPVLGGTITVTDANGKTFDMVSQLNGNFYTSNAVTFPVTVIASSCPNIQHMSATVAAGSGGCNKVGCHTAGAQGYVHLP